ncbi:MAG: hypothetical protein K5660_08945 [Paludibacteraceae bacterium]|nr:hypothetical protein [Paludibacteraceae bacterium]
MNTFLKNLGLILVLAGVVCLVVYHLSVPANGLLVASLALEAAGILLYIFLGRSLQ